ncbi:unnamed protein product [Diatraea saccharalis]|uniref:FP protein C-terminal domain-containing protein n=1 Tax=Diatraea saccharalis TaxID=40085 RepID=A0A9N9R8L0_9NEOP|nr:unnamed protein product [Diatraea saccharalis]
MLETEHLSLQDFKQELMSMLNSWKAEQQTTLSKLITEIDALKTQCTEIQKTNAEIDNTLTFLNTQHEEMKVKVERLVVEKNLNREYIISMEKQLEELQQRSRSAAIEIRDVPGTSQESESDLIATVKKLATTLDITITDHDIRDIYRRPGKPGAIKAIVAEFNSVQMKDAFIRSARGFNKDKQISQKLNYGHIGISGEIKPIFVDEYLSYSTRRLLFRAREFAKAQGYKFCWVAGGKVLLRRDSNAKFIHIRTEQCLFNLLIPT